MCIMPRKATGSARRDQAIAIVTVRSPLLSEQRTKSKRGVVPASKNSCPCSKAWLPNVLPEILAIK